MIINLVIAVKHWATCICKAEIEIFVVKGCLRNSERTYVRWPAWYLAYSRHS